MLFRSVPLLGVIGAANSPPNNHEVDALFDRFPARYWVHSIFDAEANETRLDENLRTLIFDSLAGETERLEWVANQAEVAKRVEANKVADTSDFRVAREYLLGQLGAPPAHAARNSANSVTASASHHSCR